MPIFREDYLKSDEPIAAQKRIEEGAGSEGFKNALILAGTVAGFVLARRKIALTRTFSDELRALGRAGRTYKKYIVNRVTEKTRMWPKRWPSTWRRWAEEIAKPLPTAIEQRNIAMWSMKRFSKMSTIPKLPDVADATLNRWTNFNTLWKGPAAAYIAPGARATVSRGVIGPKGGIAIDKTLYELGQTGRVLKSTGPIEIGLTAFEGRLEALRLGMYEKKSYRTLRSFVENVRLPSTATLQKEAKRTVLEKYGAEQLGMVDDVVNLEELTKKFKDLREARPELKNILTPSQLFKRESGAIKSSTNDAMMVLLNREMKKPSTHMAYKAYRAQISLGIGEPFARYEAGGIQRIERIIREHSELGIRHPFTDRLMPISARKYLPPGLTIGGMRGKSPAGFFLRPHMGGAKRTGLHLLEGTFFGVPEEIFGIGVSARGTRFTRWITKAVGADRNSYTGYFMNRYLGGFQRVMGTGFATYYGFKVINYLARQATGGWGVTDVAGKMYTSGREFQQNMLDQLGLVEGVKKFEEAFPGSIKSPLSTVARATAPLWMAWMGKKYGGAKWGRVGLALGIATALITWGDITQSPEELHRIYTGEQDIPIRKGRYWPFGRCVHPDTLVSMGFDLQFKKASDVVEGDPVINVNGKESIVNKIVSRKLKNNESIFDVRVASNRCVGSLVTNNHPLYCVKPMKCDKNGYDYCRPDRNSMETCNKFKCWKEFKPKWIKASDVNIGDFLVFPIKEFGDINCLGGVKLNKELAFIIGHYLAEGNSVVHKNGKCYFIELTCSKDEAKSKIGLYNKQFGVVSTSIVNRGKNGAKIRVFGREFCSWIHGICGSGKKKHIPDNFLDLSPNLLFNVIKGYFYGDGGFDKESPSITSSRLEFVVMMHRALLMFNITSSIVNHDSILGGVFFKSYRLHMQRSAGYLFDKENYTPAKCVNVKPSIYQFIHNGNLYSKVICKDHVQYTGSVIDFEIKEGESFCGISFVLHNTPLFGGKPKYWRPHWYPMMRSKYKYQGQLWDSETEELAQGSLLSPVLAPILQGKMWDPYYWEKKHYKDRPYPITGELFEPTMPFAWLGNLTIGQLIKPQRMMHPEYFGAAQEEAPPRELVLGAGGMLGMEEYKGEGVLPEVSPADPQWRVTQGLYTLTEQMGLRGFMLNTLSEQLTGKPDFLPEGPILQSARRATGYERAYWDMNIGDPMGVTEFFRRILPHRRRAIEEYNPIENTMPDWMPGSDYYLDFKHGDPYTKVEMGEARLPGPGYESLHRLHSGSPGVYDAVDRFMVLSDVAPYSNEYKHYRVLAKSMVRDDKYWDEKIKQHIKQRAETQREYDFLELEPPEDVTGITRPVSRLYRHALGAITSFPSPHEIIPFIPPITKILPYKTAINTYKDYRIYGDEFTSWGHPMRDFIAPWMNKVRGVSADIFGSEFIPGGEQERRDYEDYFDKLKYIKNLHLSNTAESQGNQALAKKFRSLSKQTMTGVNVYGGWADIYRAMPKRERSFFEAFSSARREDRQEILDMVPEPMQRLYKAQWNIADKKQDLPPMYNVGRTTSRDMVEYYKDYNLPAAEWTGWHPDVELEDVKLRVVNQEAMNIHKFNLWESRERAMARRPYVPTIEDIREPGSDLSALQNALYGQLETEGYQNSRINITRTPSLRNRIKMKFKVKRNRQNQYDRSMRELRYA